MRHLRLLGSLLLGLLLALILLIPALIGLQLADASTQAQLRAMTGQPGLELRLNNGWFGSSGEIEVSAPTLGGVDYPGLVLRASIALQHGPLLRTAQGFGIGLVAATLRPDIRGVPADSVIDVVAGFDGALHARLVTPSWTLPGSGTQTAIDALRLAVDIEPAGTVSLTVESSELRIRDEFMALTLDAPRVHLHSQNLARSPLPGTLDLEVAAIHMTSQDGQARTLGLQGLRVEHVASAMPGVDGRGQTLSLQQRLSVDAFDGPQPVTQLRMESQLDGIDLAAIVAQLTLLRDAQPLLAVMPAPELQAYVAQQTQDFTLRIASQNVTARTQLDLRYQDQPVQAELELRWPGEPTALSQRRVSLARALRVLHLSLNLAVNEAVFADGPYAAMISTYVNQGLLQREQDTIRLQAALFEGGLNLNEQRIALEPFLRLLTPVTP